MKKRILAVIGLAGMSAAANSQEMVETVIPDFVVNCTNAGQLCDPAFVVSAVTGSELQVQYSVRNTHCSALRVHVFVDGVWMETSDLLAWHGAPAPFSDLPLDTGILDLGPVSPGSHQIAIVAEGEESGCNIGQSNSWGGSVRRFTTPLEPGPGGNPLATCNGVPATIVGDNNDNMIFGTSGNDVIFDPAGNDTIHGLDGNDVMCGGPGRDRLSGNRGRDRLFGGTGKDVLRGGAGNDRLFGQSGNDAMNGQSGFDRCNEGSGNDTAARCEGTTSVP